MPNSLNETPIERARRFVRLVPIIVGVEAVIAIVAFVICFELFQANAQAAKDWRLALYPGYDGGYGQQVTLGALRGKVVLLHFDSALAIASFTEETQLIEQLWRKYKDQGLVVLGVFPYDAQSDAVGYLAKMGVTYPNGADPRQGTASQYGVTGFPETVILARDGELVYHGVGPQKQDKIDQVLSPLLTR